METMTAIKPNDLTRVIRWVNKDEPGVEDLQDELNVLELIPDIMEQLTGGRKELHMQDKQEDLIADLMARLSSREKECFTLHVIHKKSMQKVSDKLGISKSTVQEYINRVRSKIDAT